MDFQRGSLNTGTVIGALVMTVAIAGNVFLDWTWSNPDGKLLPLIIGIVAAIGGVVVLIQKIRIKK